MDPQLAHDQFVHIRIIIGIVTGLSVTRLLTGLARFVQHPVRDRIYLVHLAWAFFLLLAVVHSGGSSSGSSASACGRSRSTCS